YSAELQAFAQRIFAGEIRARHCGVNDHDGGRFFVVGGGDVASLKQRDAEGFHVLRGDGAVAGGKIVMRSFGWASLDIEMEQSAAAAYWQERRSSRGAHARQSFGAID